MKTFFAAKKTKALSAIMAVLVAICSAISVSGAVNVPERDYTDLAYIDASHGAVYENLTNYMYDNYFESKASETLDEDAESEENKAVEATKTSAYGTYSVLDAVYGGNKLLKCTDDSVWKFGVETEFSPEFIENADDFEFTAEKTDNGVRITPENPDSSGVFTVVAVDGSGNTYSYMSITESLVIPSSDIALPFKAQVKYKNKASEILYLEEENGEIITSERDTKSLLSQVTYKTDPNTYFVVSDIENVNSFYSLYHTRNQTTQNRSLILNARVGEKMRFGFTAPHSGQYEISAPITASGATTYYSVSVEAATPKVLTPLTEYTSAGSLVEAQTFLTKGDTVWFEVYALGRSAVDVGIPKVTLKKILSTSSVAYEYTATDYVENKTANGYTDYAAASTTENTRAAWSFGYFDVAAEATLQPYSIIKDGFYYALSDGDTKTSVGSLYPTFGDDSEDISKPIYKRTKFYGTVDNNTGIYMQFTAPFGGNGTLKLTDSTTAISGVTLTVKKNGETFETYTGVDANTTLDVGVLNPMDTVTLLFKSASGSEAQGYLGSASMTLGGSISTIKFESAAGASLYTVTAIPAANLTMPMAQKYSGLNFISWSNTKNDTLLKEGDTHAAISGIKFNTNYAYAGDMNQDNIINGDDHIAQYDVILGKTTDEYGMADIKNDGEFNLADLLKCKKLIVLGECSCK
ncbi:MAG: hypothetical protein IJO62_04635 [Clostridia bacterium]|nr:hypothetical protein [Clostridia bacterium]